MKPEMTMDQLAHAQWIYRCHRPLDREDRRKWLDFYERYFRYINEGGER